MLFVYRLLCVYDLFDTHLKWSAIQEEVEQQRAAGQGGAGMVPSEEVQLEEEVSTKATGEHLLPERRGPTPTDSRQEMTSGVCSCLLPRVAFYR